MKKPSADKPVTLAKQIVTHKANKKAAVAAASKKSASPSPPRRSNKILVSTSSNNLLSNSKLDQVTSIVDKEDAYLSRTQSSPDMRRLAPVAPLASQTVINEYESLTNFESQNLAPKKPVFQPRMAPPSTPSQHRSKSSVYSSMSASSIVKHSKKARRESKRRRNSSISSSASNRKKRLSFTEFVNEWQRQKKIYLGVQWTFLSLNFLITLIRLGLSIWIFVGIRFGIISDLANRLTYSSFSKLIGLLPLLFLFLNTVSFFVDIIRFLTHLYIRDFVNSHSSEKLYRILANQQALAAIQLSSKTVDSEFRQLRLRSQITSYAKKTLINLKAVTFMSYAVYLILIALQFFIAIVLHVYSDHIIAFQLPQTLVKVIREYEKQQLAALYSEQIAVPRGAPQNAVVNTLEEELVNSMHVYFECCHYQNQYQYGELAPPTCNLNRGCLKPMQEFVWTYVYVSVVVVLFLASVKFLIEILLAINFALVLNKRLVGKVYYANLSRLGSLNQAELDELMLVGEEDALDRLQAIRRAKEEKLEKEDLEEERRRRDQELEARLAAMKAKRQEEYERMLFEQNRFDELERERLNRRLQNQFSEEDV